MLMWALRLGFQVARWGLTLAMVPLNLIPTSIVSTFVSLPWSMLLPLCFLLLPICFLLLLATVYASRWLVWLGFCALLAVLQLAAACYQLVRITADLALLSGLKLLVLVFKGWQSTTSGDWRCTMRAALTKAESYEEYSALAEKIDAATAGKQEWKANDEDFPQAKVVADLTRSLREAREGGHPKQVIFLVSGILRRNHLGVDDAHLHLKALSTTKNVISEYRTEVCRCLEYLSGLTPQQMPVGTKMRLFRKAAQSYGKTALCLSGGGSLAMKHMGVLRALVQSGHYKHIRVVSGTSGGSIVAGMCAVKRDEELLSEVTVDDVSTDFRRDGSMKRDNIRWFPPLIKQAWTFLRKGYLVEREDFEKCTEHYWRNITFEEAYAITGKHVCIGVTAARSPYSGPQRLLLNHVTTPHVLIRSAVAASCSLPGIMPPSTLLAKKADGTVHNFEVDGLSWIDGSVQADVPFSRMSSLFRVSTFIVSQVNVHVLPFVSHNIPQTAMYPQHEKIRLAMSLLDLDIGQRTATLSKLGLMPRLFGNDISKVFQQKYHGHATLVPELLNSDVLALRMIRNPTVEDMQRYIKQGLAATYPQIRFIDHLLRLETVIWTCLGRAQKQLKQVEHYRGVPMHLAQQHTDKQPRQDKRQQQNKGQQRQVGGLFAKQQESKNGEGETPPDKAQAAAELPDAAHLHRDVSTSSLVMYPYLRRGESDDELAAPGNRTLCTAGDITASPCSSPLRPERNRVMSNISEASGESTTIDEDSTPHMAAGESSCGVLGEKNKQLQYSSSGSNNSQVSGSGGPRSTIVAPHEEVPCNEDEDFLLNDGTSVEDDEMMDHPPLLRPIWQEWRRHRSASHQHAVHAASDGGIHHENMDPACHGDGGAGAPRNAASGSGAEDVVTEEFTRSLEPRDDCASCQMLQRRLRWLETELLDLQRSISRQRHAGKQLSEDIGADSDTSTSKLLFGSRLHGKPAAEYETRSLSHDEVRDRARSRDVAKGGGAVLVDLRGRLSAKRADPH